MDSLKLLAHLKYSRYLVSQAKKLNLQHIDPFSENKTAFLAARQMAALANNCLYAETLFRYRRGEEIDTIYLRGLTDVERQIFVSHYTDQIGFKEIAERLEADTGKVSKQWKSALSKVLSNMSPRTTSRQQNYIIRPTPKEMKYYGGLWYAVQVKTGSEEALVYNIRQYYSQSNPVKKAVTATNRVVTFSKSGIRENYETILKGYIFIKVSEMNANVWHWLKKFPGVIRVLREKPLSREEIKNVLKYCGQEARIKVTPGVSAHLSEVKNGSADDITKDKQRIIRFPLDLLRKEWERVGNQLVKEQAKQRFTVPMILQTMRLAL